MSGNSAVFPLWAAEVGGLNWGLYGEAPLSPLLLILRASSAAAHQVSDRGLPRRSNSAGPPFFRYFLWRSIESNLPPGNPRPRIPVKPATFGAMYHTHCLYFSTSLNLRSIKPHLFRCCCKSRFQIAQWKDSIILGWLSAFVATHKIILQPTQAKHIELIIP